MTTVSDADRMVLSEALRPFTRESAGSDVSRMYYAGHGLEVEGATTWFRWTRGWSGTRTGGARRWS